MARHPCTNCRSRTRSTLHFPDSTQSRWRPVSQTSARTWPWKPRQTKQWDERLFRTTGVCRNSHRPAHLHRPRQMRRAPPTLAATASPTPRSPTPPTKTATACLTRTIPTRTATASQTAPRARRTRTATASPTTSTPTRTATASPTLRRAPPTLTATASRRQGVQHRRQRQRRPA